MRGGLESSAPGGLTRRELMRWLALSGATAMAGPSLAATLSACESSARSAQTAGGSVSFAISAEPKVLNPTIHTLDVESIVISLLFPGLVRMNATGHFEGDLAASYEIQDGGMTYRFELRPGLTWQDRRPLTSRDFVFTYQTYIDPRTNAAYSTGWDRIERVETPDASTVVYRMKEVFAPFLESVASGPVLPEHVLAGVQDVRRADFNRNPLGCGPFKLKDWQTGSQIVLEANHAYWRGAPALDEFVFKVVPDAASQVNQLANGEVDIISVGDLALWDHVKGMAPKVSTTAFDDTRYQLVQLDEYDFLKDVTVRQALDYATPKPDIVKGVLHGLAVVAASDVPPNSPYYNASVKGRPFSLSRARALLAQAGFAMQDGVMTKDGRPLEVPIYTIATSPTYVRIAQVLKESWAKIGVRTSVTTMDVSTLFSQQGPQWNRQAAALIYTWTQGVDPVNVINWSSTQIPRKEGDPGENVEGYRNPRVDELVVEGVRVADFARRKTIYDELQQILAEEVPVIFLCFPKALYAHTPRLHGFVPNAYAGVLDEVWKWHLG